METVITSLSLSELIKLLPEDIEMKANLELARRVCANESRTVDYYISTLCKSNIDFIAKSIVHRYVMSEYYMFLCNPISEENVPQWKKVRGYKAANDCTLKTYTSTIACRHFAKIAKKEKEEEMRKDELLEFMDYEALLVCDKVDDDSDSPTRAVMRKAYSQLLDRDKMVLKLLIIEKKNSLEAFELLKDNIHPRAKDGMTSDEVKANMNVKQKQDAVSLLKGRALERLQEFYLVEYYK